MSNVKLPSKETMEKGLEKVIDFVTSIDSVTIEKYVDKLAEQNLGISNDKLAKKILTESH